MATYIKTLREHGTNDIIYPKTVSGAVYRSGKLTESVETALQNLERQGGMTVDSQISSTSTNPLENQAIHAAIASAVASLELRSPAVYFDTKEHWNAQPDLVGEANSIYIYTNYKTVDGQNMAGIKVGDGQAYLIDNPFLDEFNYNLITTHTSDTTAHVTSAERTSWNKRVACYYSLTNNETLVLTTDTSNLDY